MKHSFHKTKKASTFQSRLPYLFISTIPSGGFRLTTSAHCLTNRFVCNFLSSSAGFNLCRCFFRFTLVFAFAPTFSGPSIPRLTPLPFRFLTSAVLAFFRPPQFWILTTQPLFCLSFSSRFRLTAAFPVPASALASAVSPFSPA